jgi:hypothetical protein
MTSPGGSAIGHHRRRVLAEVREAAMRWLERYLAESSPKLKHFAEITASLAALRRAGFHKAGGR